MDTARHRGYHQQIMTTEPTSMRRPNILILFADQQRADTLGCYGQPLPVTPHLDRLAQQGVRFATAVTCQPVCGPARAALQTGRWPTAIGCQVNDLGMSRDAKTIAHHLGDVGYQTAYFGKWHLASDSFGRGEDGEVRNHHAGPIPADLRGGWRDAWEASDVLEFTSHGYGGHIFGHDNTPIAMPEGRYRADFLADRALEWLEHRRDPQRPFLAMVSWIEPHHQNDRNRHEGPTGSAARWQNFVPPGDLAHLRGVGDWESSYPDYLGCCEAVDANVGRLLEALDRLGMAQDTVVIYAADHGSHFRTRNGEYKRSAHDASVRIPLLLRGPGFAGGTVAPGVASLIDLPRTILTAAGVGAPRTMAGCALQHGAGDAAFIQISEQSCSRAIRTDRWTYALTDARTNPLCATSTTGVWVEDMLYDNHQDPHQQTNRLDDASLTEVRLDLRKRLTTWMREQGDPVKAVRSPGDLGI
jgi:arylsulfatase A-like enzyme